MLLLLFNLHPLTLKKAVSKNKSINSKGNYVLVLLFAILINSTFIPPFKDFEMQIK